MKASHMADSLVSSALRQYKQRDYHAAYKTLMAASLQEPNEPRITVGIAHVLERLHRYEEADRQWRHILRVIPDAYDATNKIRHARVLIEIEAFEDAARILQQVPVETTDNAEKDNLIRRISSRETPKNCRERSAGAFVSKSGDLLTKYQALTKNSTNNAPSIKYQSIIIVTYGRTGSTLLQGFLNTINGVCVLGENNNAFYSLFEFAKKIDELKKIKSTETPSSPFFGAAQINSEGLSKAIQETISAYFEPFLEESSTQCIGFKEVKYGDHLNQLLEYLRFLEEVFPNPAFVFLWRDHEEVLKSGWWKSEDWITSLALLKAVEDRATEFSCSKKNCFQISYADLLWDSPKLAKLFEFLGVDFNADKIRLVRSIPHSYQPENEGVQRMFQQERKSK